MISCESAILPWAVASSRYAETRDMVCDTGEGGVVQSEEWMTTGQMLLLGAHV